MLGKLFKRKSSPVAGDLPPEAGPEAPSDGDPMPDRPIYAIGDVHGCSDLLAHMLDVIDADADTHGPGAKTTLVLLGDYVDRGEDSAGVLTQLLGLARSVPGNVAMLMGNHERIMLDFMDDPSANGALWLSNGGLQTLASFRIGGLTENASEGALHNAADDLRRAMHALDPSLETWLRGLPLSWVSGNVAFVHAAADPAKDIADQSAESLLWGNADFARRARSDGLWCVHGHTVVARPEVSGRRINIDTGACYSGALSAIALTPGQTPRFLRAGTPS
ncbi:MAG: serine/threonine protein phosphatase [Rhodobacteraceae bacterium]|nr:serine/threonine protein phosphatase [Paracoccaceae bacterium]